MSLSTYFEYWVNLFLALDVSKSSIPLRNTNTCISSCLTGCCIRHAVVTSTRKWNECLHVWMILCESYIKFVERPSDVLIDFLYLLSVKWPLNKFEVQREYKSSVYTLPAHTLSKKRTAKNLHPAYNLWRNYEYPTRLAVVTEENTKKRKKERALLMILCSK